MDDWNTIWRSEAAALAADREAPELWAAGAAQWTAQATARWAELVRAGRGAAGERTEGRTRPDAPPRAAPAPPSSDVVADLERRVAELELRLAGRGPPPND